MSLPEKPTARNKTNLKIKVCGMRDPENIRQLAALSPDYMGFIFYAGSKRYAGNLDGNILKGFPASLKKTGVFVNAARGEIMDKAAQYGLNAVQLHGIESPELCRALRSEGLEVIKVFGIDESFNFSRLQEYTDTADHFLFDTQSSQHGGTGKTFDWTLLERSAIGKSYFLSGGIGPEHTEAIRNFGDPALYAIDLNSRFETAPGLKDIGKLTRIFNELRNQSAPAEQ